MIEVKAGDVVIVSTIWRASCEVGLVTKASDAQVSFIRMEKLPPGVPPSGSRGRCKPGEVRGVAPDEATARKRIALFEKIQAEHEARVKRVLAGE